MTFSIMSDLFSGKGFLVFILIFGASGVLSGNVPPAYFSSLTIEEGLPSNEVSSVTQDRYGFIWIGTGEGLSRYDGFRMMHFQETGTPGSIPSNRISALLSDGDKIWVGSWNGLCTIDVQTFEIKPVNAGPSKVIRALYKDDSGIVWIGTAEGLLKYNQAENSYTFFDTSNSGLSHNTIRSFHEDDNGDMWIGTYDGLNRFRDGEFVSFEVKGTYKPFLENNLIVSIQDYSGDCDSLLWVGTETGLARFNTHTGNYQLYNVSNTNLSNEVIKTIYHQSDSLLWLGTDFGLNVFNTATGDVSTFFHDPLIDNTIANNVVWDIFEDRQKRVWLVTSGGLSLVDKSKSYYTVHEEFFRFEEPRIGNKIRDVHADTEGDIWLATIHGMVRLNKGSGEREVFSTDSEPGKRLLLDNVFALEDDGEDCIWIGTAGGINIWDKQRQKMYSVTASSENGLTSNYISGFAKESDGTFWVSAWEGGVFRVEQRGEDGEDLFFHQVDDDGEGRLISSRDAMYYASGSDLWRFAKEGAEKKLVDAVAEKLTRRDITAILSGRDGNLWIAAEDKLIKYHSEKQTVEKIELDITPPQKLMNLEDDFSGNIWGTTQNSVVRIYGPRNEMVTIPVNPSSPFKGFYSWCSASTRDDQILFGGDNAYIEIAPEQVAFPEEKPKIYISGLRINNRQISPVSSPDLLNCDIAYMNVLELKHNQNSLTFEFSTLDYLYSGKGQYRYRLNPVQEDWIYSSGSKNFAVFANVSPGEYTFEVQGTNYLGMWSDSRVLKVNISPSVWLSKGFIILYFGLIVALTYFIFRIYSYRQRLNNELKIVTLEKEHSETLYQSKIRFFTNISHEFRTPLGLIISPLKQLAGVQFSDSKHNRMIELAWHNAERLYKLINQLLDFRKIESARLQLVPGYVNMVAFCREVVSSFDDLAQRHQIYYNFQTDLEELNCTVDREKVETIIFNLLSNAFKHTPEGGTVTLHLTLADKRETTPEIILSVVDSGSGISKEDQENIFELFYQTGQQRIPKTGTGIGLTLSMEYARLHGGTIELESEPGKGSTFTLRLPFVASVSALATENSDFKKRNPATEHIHENKVLPPNARKLLLVDDNQELLDYLSINLSLEYHLIYAEDGHTALELARKEIPDLIISDVMMPVMHGIELCANIKEHAATAHIPVILLTAKTLDVDKTAGMNKGADMYITKPFDIEFLRSSIKSIFRREEQVAQYVKNQLMLSPGPSEPKESAEALFLKKIMTVVERNVSNPDLSVEMISETMGMSSTHLYRRLKEITGFSSREIIINYRMQKAAQMLKNQEGNITEVMYSVGFSSLSSFSKSFKAKFGMSPRKYSEQGRSNS